jgi:hypothetical protein
MDEATDNKRTDYADVGGVSLRLSQTGAGAVVPVWTHADTLGSAVAATDAAGAVLWRESPAAAAAFSAYDRSTGSIVQASA